MHPAQISREKFKLIRVQQTMFWMACMSLSAIFTQWLVWSVGVESQYANGWILLNVAYTWRKLFFDRKHGSDSDDIRLRKAFRSVGRVGSGCWSEEYYHNSAKTRSRFALTRNQRCRAGAGAAGAGTFCPKPEPWNNIARSRSRPKEGPAPVHKFFLATWTKQRSTTKVGYSIIL